MNQRRFLFLTTINLASNPRLVKELRLAVEKGFACTVVTFSLGNTSDLASKAIGLELPQVNFICLSATPSPLLPWLLSSLLQRLFSLFPPKFLTNSMLSIAVSKRSLLLWWKLKMLRKEKFNWIIAHNPAAFYPALIAAKQFGAKLGIDVEDYHPGETTIISEQHRMRTLMQRTLPQADYCSFAAPLIRTEVQKDIVEMPKRQLVILNGFSHNEFSRPIPNQNAVLKVIWFSQHIAAGRGLEFLIPVVNKLYPKVELHLVGALNEQFEQMFLRDKSGVVIRGILSQKELHQLLSEFDVGMATDLPVNRNREISLTNKILAYAQAGLVIAAMHTEAQDKFLQLSNLYFVQMKNTSDSIEKALLQLFQDKVSGKIDPISQYEKGRYFCWEEQNRSLLETWNSVV